MEALAKRRAQNRRAQRNYRNNIKKHIKGLEVVNSALMQPYTLTPGGHFSAFPLDGSIAKHPFGVGNGTTRLDKDDTGIPLMWRHGNDDPFGPPNGDLASSPTHSLPRSFGSSGYSNDQTCNMYGSSRYTNGSQADSAIDLSSGAGRNGGGFALSETVCEPATPPAASSDSFAASRAPAEIAVMARSSQVSEEMGYPNHSVVGPNVMAAPSLNHTSPAASMSPPTPSAPMHFQHQPLLHAIRHGRTHLVQLLIEHSADLNRPGPDGRTPLHIAAMTGNVDIVHILLQNGAALEAVDSDGCTALVFAVIHDRYSVVAALLESGADVNG